MRIAGIICECNPFHKGHQFLISSAKADGADLVICLMSGYFSQRGDAVIADPFTRGAAMLQGGADLVLELPFPFSSASAEYFAFVGVKILASLGVTELWFGSESGDLEKLKRWAEAGEEKNLQDAYAEKNSTGTAKTYFDLLQGACGAEERIPPNEILGIQYLRAIKKYAKNLLPKTVKRQGDGYAQTAAQSEFPSATALRRTWEEKGLREIAGYLPCGSLSLLQKAEEEGLAPASLQNAASFVLGKLRTLPDEEIQKRAELSGGLGRRICTCAKKATSPEELFSLAATKKYPDARIRRGVLYALLGVNDGDLRTDVGYVRLFAANRAGKAHLSRLRGKTSLPVVTKQSDLPAGFARQKELECALHNLYTLCLPKTREGGFFLRKTPVFPNPVDEKSRKSH